MKIDINSYVVVELTTFGAKKLNERNRRINEVMPKGLKLKTNHRDGFKINDVLFSIFERFAESLAIGEEKCFKIIEVKG